MDGDSLDSDSGYLTLWGTLRVQIRIGLQWVLVSSWRSTERAPGQAAEELRDRCIAWNAALLARLCPVGVAGA